jgi:hypothetical protein
MAAPKMTTTEKATTEDLLLDGNYIRWSSKLIADALRENCDVLQMPNGDVVITAVRTMTYQYSWDAKKRKMVRSQSGIRQKKLRHAREDELMQDDHLLENA